MPSGSKIGGSIAAVLAGAGFGVGGAISQILAQQGFAIAHIVVIEFFVGAVFLGIISAIVEKTPVTAKQAFSLVALGIINCLASICYFTAIDILSVGQAVAMQFQYVWIAVLIQSVVEKTRPSVITLISTVLIIVGTVFGSGVADEILQTGIPSIDPVGVAFAMGCAITYGAFLYLNGRVVSEKPPLTRSFYLTLGGLAIASVYGNSFYTGSCDIPALLPGGLIMGLIMAVIPGACLAIAARSLPGGIVAVLSSSELPVAVLAGVMLLGETATPLTVLGVVIIVAAIALSNYQEIKDSNKFSGATE